MNKIEVAVIETHGDPAVFMMLLARITQRGHNITSMADIKKLIDMPVKDSTVRSIARLPHGTIKRFTPITIAIVGASRRFLAQARTHQVGFNYVSGSLQYSNYSGKAQFVVPYSILEEEAKGSTICGMTPTEFYLNSCKQSMASYSIISTICDNDTAGYVSPAGLRNVLIIQGNHQAWEHFIKLRCCNRNTNETQYVALRIWEELLNTKDGEDMLHWAGPECIYGKCREGSMTCGEPFKFNDSEAIPTQILKQRWPLLYC